MVMLDGALRQPVSDGETARGPTTAFVPDAEAVEKMTVAMLDAGADAARRAVRRGSLPSVPLTPGRSPSRSA
jgi:hypothetical protein